MATGKRSAAGIQRAPAAIGSTPAQQQRIMLWCAFLPFWATAIGAVSVWAWRRQAAADRFTAALPLCGATAFLGGVCAFALVFLLFDAGRLLLRH